MTEHTDTGENLDKDTEVLKDVAAQVEREREEGASAFEVPDDDRASEAEEPEDEADGSDGEIGTIPPSRPGMGQ